MRHLRGYKTDEMLKTELLKYKIIDKDTNCWLWLRSYTHSDKSNPYGQIHIGTINKKKIATSTSKLSYRLFKGENPNNLLVLHNCNNSRCHNPDHLRLGTKSDNAKDMYNVTNLDDPETKRILYARMRTGFKKYYKRYNKAKAEGTLQKRIP